MANPETIDPPKLAARQLLLLCASSSTDLAYLPHPEIDWAYLLNLGQRHGLLPLIYERLRGLENDVVLSDVMAHLQGIYYTNLRRNLRLQAHLIEAVNALHKMGIKPIVLKGGALASTVYPDLGLRPMVDLDLLIPSETMEQAGIALSTLGYHLPDGLPAPMAAFRQRFGGGLEWLREGDCGLTRIDLQHNLVGVDICRQSFAIEPDALWAAAQPLSLDRTQALQLSPEDMLLHLCLHPALHHGYASPLIGCVDIDRLVASKGSGAFWRRLVARAGQFRIRTIVYRGLRGARDLLGTAVPDGTLDALAPGACRQRFVTWLPRLDEDRIWERAERQPSGFYQLLLYAALMERPRDAVGMVRAILFPGREWLSARYGLQGERQAALHRLVHPLRVARAFLRCLHRPLVQSGLD